MPHADEASCGPESERRKSGKGTSTGVVLKKNDYRLAMDTVGCADGSVSTLSGHNDMSFSLTPVKITLSATAGAGDEKSFVVHS